MTKKKPAKQVKPRDGFTKSDKHVLNGLKLYPWTAEREIAGNSMGMLYPRIGKDAFDQYKRTKMYPGLLRDLIVCLWLCTQNEDEVDDADSAPVDAYKRARQWATSRGIHKVDSDEFWQAAGRFVKIVTEVNNAITTPKVEPGEEADEGKE